MELDRCITQNQEQLFDVKAANENICKKKNFYTHVTRIKDNYLKQIRNSLKETDGLVLYGAGGMGQSLFSFLKKHNLNVTAFCVTNLTYNKDYKTGIAIYPLSYFSNCNKKYTFLVATEKYRQPIIDNLKNAGIQTYIDIPPYIEIIVSNKFLRPVLEITPRIGCSVNCRYCPQELLVKQYLNFSNPIIEMDINHFIKCIDKIPIDTLIFFAGFAEPFLAKDAIRMMQYVAEKGLSISLATTLVGFNLSDFDKIKDIPFDDIVLHIPDKNRFANIKISDEYVKLCNLFINMKKATGERIVSSISCQCEPDKELLPLLNKTHIPVSWELHDRAGNLPDSDLPHFQNKHGTIICGRSLNLNWNILLPNGDVVLCCMDFGLKYKLGNLLQDTYENIISGQVMQDIEKSLDEESSEVICRNCVFSIHIDTFI